MTRNRASRRAAGAAGAFAALGGSLLGAALQLQQPVLWPAWVYAGALAPALEGQDLRVTGVVSEMPQRNEAGTRFTLDVESARWADAGAQGLPVVPDRIVLGWYAEGSSLWSRAPRAVADVAVLHAGERWSLTVRLKAPHGNRNPHGFDGELWMWEQGLHASGHVRSGTRDVAPVLVDSTWRHPIERAREAVRDAIFDRVPDRARAGVIAALVTGDQNAIDRAAGTCSVPRAWRT
ncbi:putative competence protein ComA-like [Ditylenchus destructor]|uniref:Competence protein ComA-like n=1 Tax=Ditylenchus destructor TaxID=166010 RepID=A0AAD4MEN7_9BILA|nr:putative competence protein ComA-like [Ditylenchus destructor]